VADVRAVGPGTPEELVAQSPVPTRIQLTWPGKDSRLEPLQQPNGTWEMKEGRGVVQLRPFVDLESYPPTGSASTSLVVEGSRIDALRTLARAFLRTAKLIYLDFPRVDVDDETASFRGDPTRVYSTWFSVLRAHLEAALPLLSRQGVLVVHVGDAEEPYARLILEELCGRENRVASIVWQRAYAPRNMRGMKEFTATHDCLLVFASSRESLPRAGRRVSPEGFENPDGDPRGPWKAEHKGAHSRREKSDFDTFVPPYRWRLAAGRLPRGLWRVSPLTGVLWGTPEEEGRFPLTIEVADSAGERSSKRITLTCARTGAPPQPPEIPWLFHEHQAVGPLAIESTKLPTAIVGEEYSAILLASGGKPYLAAPKRPGSGRYWEFSIDTLLAAYQNDSVHLGRKGEAIPHPKAYLPKEGESVVLNQVTWWRARDGEGKSSVAFAGYTEDATKHLKKLAALGLIQSHVTTAKPEPLLARLLDIFTDPGDVVIELFGDAASLSAVSLKMQRRFLYLAGASERELRLLGECSLPRLRAVIDGNDKDLAARAPEIRMRDDAYIPFSGGGAFTRCRLGDALLERGRLEDFPRLRSQEYVPFERLREAILTSQGFIPVDGDRFGARSMFDTSFAVVLPPTEYLTREVASELISRLTSDERLAIFYFRSAPDFDETLLSHAVTLRRVPTELQL
jgi:hypothetical protein